MGNEIKLWQEAMTRATQMADSGQIPRSNIANTAHDYVNSKSSIERTSRSVRVAPGLHAAFNETHIKQVNGQRLDEVTAHVGSIEALSGKDRGLLQQAAEAIRSGNRKYAGKFIGQMSASSGTRHEARAQTGKGGQTKLNVGINGDSRFHNVQMSAAAQNPHGGRSQAEIQNRPGNEHVRFTSADRTEADVRMTSVSKPSGGLFQGIVNKLNLGQTYVEKQLGPEYSKAVAQASEERWKRECNQASAPLWGMAEEMASGGSGHESRESNPFDGVEGKDFAGLADMYDY